MDTTKAIENKVALMRLGLTQAQVARDLKVHKVVVNQVLHGKRKSRKVEAYLNRIFRKAAEECPKSSDE